MFSSTASSSRECVGAHPRWQLQQRSPLACLGPVPGNRINQWPLKKLAISGAVAAWPGNFLTPRASRTRRNVL